MSLFKNRKVRKEKEIQPKSITVNYVLSLLYEIFSLLTPLITAPYISRVLGAEAIGLYSYTDSIAQYFIIFGNLGITTYGQMEVARNRHDRNKLSQVFYELWIVRTCAMILSLVVYIAISFNSTEYRIAMLILGVLIVSSMFDLTWLFRGIEDFSKVVVRNIIIKLVMISMIFIVVKTSDDIYKYLLLVVLSNLLGNVSFFIPLKKVILKPKIKEFRFLKHIKPCFVFFIPTIATSVYKLLDKTMIGLLTEGSAQNGYYEQASKIQQILILSITSLNQIMRSRMTFLYERNMISRMKELLSRSISYILLISLPMVTGLLIVSQVFIPLFLGKGFDECVPILKVLAFLIPIVGLSNCLNTHYLGPSGKQAKNNYILIIGAILNVLSNSLLIPLYGALGAAYASVIAELIILFGYLYLAREFIKFSVFVKLGWRYLLGSILMYIILPFLSIGNSQILTLFIQISAGATIYIITILILQDPFLIYWKVKLTSKVRRMLYGK